MAERLKQNKQFANICTVYGSKNFPKCDICQKEDALFDAMTMTGRYGYMCKKCFLYGGYNPNPLDSGNTLMIKSDIPKEEQLKVQNETAEYLANNLLPTEKYAALFLEDNVKSFIEANKEALTSSHVGILIKPFMPLEVVQLNSYKEAEEIMSIQGEPVAMRALTYYETQQDGTMFELLGNDAMIDDNCRFLYLKPHFFNGVGNLLISKHSEEDMGADFTEALKNKSQHVRGFDEEEDEVEDDFSGYFQPFTEEDFPDLIDFIVTAFHSRQYATMYSFH